MFNSSQNGRALSVVILILLSIFSTSIACSAAIVIGGTGNAIGTMRLLGDAYQKINPQVEVTVLPSIGSSGAIKALPKGRIDIGLSARPLKKAESEKGMIAIEYARSPTIFAVSNDLKVSRTTIPDMVKIYNGSLKQWSDGTTIRPIIRQPGDDNTKQIKALSSELKNAVEIAENRQGLLFASTDQETVNKIEQTPGSFGVTSLALLLSEKRNIHALALDGVEPTIESIVSGNYPMFKQFYFILPLQRSVEVEAFLKFVSSSTGVAILKQNGNYPVH